MGARFSATFDDPAVSPRTDRPPTFDPLYGFPNGRKPRVMKASWEELEHQKIQMGDRDYCSHLLIAYKKCQRKNMPFANYKCAEELEVLQHCEYEDSVMRMKEFERERRLLKRAARKKKIQEENANTA